MFNEKQHPLVGGEKRKQNIECNANSTHKPVGDDVLDVPKRTIRCDKISTYAETITFYNNHTIFYLCHVNQRVVAQLTEPDLDPYRNCSSYSLFFATSNRLFS